MKYIYVLSVLSLITVAFVVGYSVGIDQHAPLRDYQIRLEPDTAYLYDGTRLVGSGPHGKDGIDSLILLDTLNVN